MFENNKNQICIEIGYMHFIIFILIKIVWIQSELNEKERSQNYGYHENRNKKGIFLPINSQEISKKIVHTLKRILHGKKLILILQKSLSIMRIHKQTHCKIGTADFHVCLQVLSLDW